MSEQVRPQLVWLPDGFGGGEHAHVYCATDYAALHAEAEALRAALFGIASVNPAERGIEWAKSYASDGLKGAGSELYARWLDTFKEAEALRAQVSALQSDAIAGSLDMTKGARTAQRRRKAGKPSTPATVQSCAGCAPNATPLPPNWPDGSEATERFTSRHCAKPMRISKNCAPSWRRRGDCWPNYAA